MFFTILYNIVITKYWLHFAVMQYILEPILRQQFLAPTPPPAPPTPPSPGNHWFLLCIRSLLLYVIFTNFFGFLPHISNIIQYFSFSV